MDAYLTPVIKRYLESFSRGFDDNLSKVNVSFMQSDGGKIKLDRMGEKEKDLHYLPGLTPMQSFFGNKSILSGPAGGVVGYAITSKLAGGNMV